MKSNITSVALQKVNNNGNSGGRSLDEFRDANLLLVFEYVKGFGLLEITRLRQISKRWKNLISQVESNNWVYKPGPPIRYYGTVVGANHMIVDPYITVPSLILSLSVQLATAGQNFCLYVYSPSTNDPNVLTCVQKRPVTLDTTILHRQQTVSFASSPIPILKDHYIGFTSSARVAWADSGDQYCWWGCAVPGNVGQVTNLARGTKVSCEGCGFSITCKPQATKLGDLF